MINGHGDDINRYETIEVNFSSNVFMHFNHEGLYAHIASHLPTIQHYPEPAPRELECLIAERNALLPEQVMVTSGATEAIYLTAQAFQHSSSAILSPSFAEYADACNMHHHHVTHFSTLHQLPDNTQMVWLCTPNNPTGQCMEQQRLVEELSLHPDVVFVIDSSYADYTDVNQIAQGEVPMFNNLIMLRSMTKRYAVPGLRLGYVVANERLLQRLRSFRIPWSVNQLAIVAGEYLLRHDEDYRLPLNMLLSERRRLCNELSAMQKMEVYPSNSHILLCRLWEGTAAQLKERLATRYGILIRDASNFHSLTEHHFRIAVQTPEDNDKLLAALRNE